MHYAYPATIFLAELLPSRAPLRFKPQGKDNDLCRDDQKEGAFFSLQFDL